MIVAPTILERVREVYGEACLDWIEALAKACDATSQTAVATDLGYSRTVVNLVVNGRYDRDMAEVERRVRELIMGPVVVACPVLDEISSATCRSNQALPYSNANPSRVALYRACRRGCLHSAITYVEHRHE